MDVEAGRSVDEEIYARGSNAGGNRPPAGDSGDERERARRLHREQAPQRLAGLASRRGAGGAARALAVPLPGAGRWTFGRLLVSSTVGTSAFVFLGYFGLILLAATVAGAVVINIIGPGTASSRPAVAPIDTAAGEKQGAASTSVPPAQPDDAKPDPLKKSD